MKRIKNLSVYNLLGYFLLGIAAYAFINASNTDLQATAPVTEEPTQSINNRHTITLTLNQLDELKVTEGQRINSGDIISDRTYTRVKIQAKKDRLETAIAKAKLPLNQLKPVPIPKFETELAALKQAQFNLDVIVREIDNFDKQLHFKDPFYSSVFESEKIQELADLKRKELEASINVEQAHREADLCEIATLDEAKLNYQKQQYEHSLKVSDYQTSLQKQQEQVNSLQLQLDKVNDELETLVSVYSPYRGKVRRVKILGQSERDINVEVTLDVRQSQQ